VRRLSLLRLAQTFNFSHCKYKAFSLFVYAAMEQKGQRSLKDLFMQEGLLCSVHYLHTANVFLSH